MKTILCIGFVIALGVFAWGPWLTKEVAEQKASQAFVASWEGIIDGCGFSCEKCGVKNSRKQPFGYSITIEYGCGMKLGTRIGEIFISVIGSVHGSSLHRN